MGNSNQFSHIGTQIQQLVAPSGTEYFRTQVGPEFNARVPALGVHGVVTLFSNTGLTGDLQSFGDGDYPDLGGFNDQACSFTMAGHTSVTFYTANDYQGESTYYTNNNDEIFALTDLTVFKNMIRSMQISKV